MDSTKFYLLRSACTFHASAGAGLCAIISVINTISRERITGNLLFKKVSEAMQICVDAYSSGQQTNLSKRSCIVLRDKWTPDYIKSISNFKDKSQTVPFDKRWSKELLEFYLLNLIDGDKVFELFFFIEIKDLHHLVLINTVDPLVRNQDKMVTRRIAIAQLYVSENDLDTVAIMDLDMAGQDLEETLGNFDRTIYIDFYSGKKRTEYIPEVISLLFMYLSSF